MASYFITQKRIYNTLDSDSIVLEKCNFVHEKSLNNTWISFLKKCGNHVYDGCNYLSILLVKGAPALEKLGTEYAIIFSISGVGVTKVPFVDFSVR